MIDAASKLRADLYFMGVTGVHPKAGLSTGDAEESEAGAARALGGDHRARILGEVARRLGIRRHSIIRDCCGRRSRFDAAANDQRYPRERSQSGTDTVMRRLRTAPQMPT